MDRFGHSTASSLDELRQIQSDARSAHSLKDLRTSFDRVQELRRIHAGSFDIQLLVAEAQEQIIERARDLRSRPGVVSNSAFDETLFAQPKTPPPEPEPAATATGPLDRKTWRRATYLAFALLAVLCVGFFYLIQMARRINFPPPTPAPAAQPTQPPAKSPATLGNVPPSAASTVSTSPTVRLYTDLIPGTVSVDDGDPQDLKDGELILDHLEPGRHSIKVAGGHNGAAAFSFDVSDTAAPQFVAPLSASNAMAVLISAQDGKGRVVTSLSQPDVSIDGKAAGQAGPDGLALNDLGKADHEVQVAQGNDRQRFVLTYSPAPVLTVYLKSDPNTGVVNIDTGQDDASIFIGDKLYRRKTDHGQIRLPLKVGTYSIRVHKDGFVDPPAQSVDVVKGQEAKLSFDLQPVPDLASLQIEGAAPGTTVLIDDNQVAITAADGSATVKNVKQGEHAIELRHDGFTPKKFQRDFTGGAIVALSTPDSALEKLPPENKSAVTTPPANPADTAATATESNPGEQVRHGGGFVHYNSSKTPGRYSFQAHSKFGGFLKHEKLQWYAGYQNSENYVMFSLDGKHATVREMRDGKLQEVNRIPFNLNSGEWVQVDMSINSGSITASVKAPDSGWSEIGTVASNGRDFTQDKVGFYVPGNEEVAVSNFHFAAK